MERQNKTELHREKSGGVDRNHFFFLGAFEVDFEVGFEGTAFLAATGFVPALAADFPLTVLGGGVVFPLDLGGTARIRHLGPEPIRSSRWALISASFTK